MLILAQFEKHCLCLSILEKEKWKSSTMELEVILKQVQPIPFLMEAFELKEKENKVVMKDSTFFE